MSPLDRLKESLEAVAEHHADQHDPESAGTDINLVVQVYFSSVGRSDISELMQSVLVYR